MLIRILLAAILPCVLGMDAIVGVGGLFEDNEIVQKAFESSIVFVNEERLTDQELPRCWMRKTTVNVMNDLFEVGKEACRILDDGVVAIFGPHDPATSKFVRSMCDGLDMPHITARWDPEEPPSKSFYNLYPYSHSLAKVFPDLVTELKWESLTIIYENTDSLIRMNQLLKMWGPEDQTVTIRQLEDGPNYRAVLQDVRDSQDFNIVIDCSTVILPEVLKQAQQVGIMSSKYTYIIATLDFQTIDWEPYQYSGVTIVGMNLTNPKVDVVDSIFNKHKDAWNMCEPSELPVEAALMYDAVQIFSRALRRLENASDETVMTTLCTNGEAWPAGTSLSNFIGKQAYDGLTGYVQFDTSGYRSEFYLNVLSVTKAGLQKIGGWHSVNGLDALSIISETDSERSIRSECFTVLIAMSKPYGMEKNESRQLTGNDRYEGFGIDMIDRISKMLGFSYVFKVEPDYGSPDKITKEWTGMMRALQDNKAQLAITDLTITADRMTVADFTPPFMSLGISILYTVPGKSKPRWFSFLSPFSNDVWLCLIAAYIVVSLLLFIVGRLSPAEWNNPYPCIEEPEELENQFNLKNSLWFTIGSIMQQGSEIAPIGISTRMMAGCWWFFCLIIVSSYTANLAAFLTVETPEESINTAQELADKDGLIKYGAKAEGSTFGFFKNSEKETYKKMFEYMEKNKKEVLTKTNEEGMEKVLQGGYAFLAESLYIDYVTERQCNLTKIGGLLDAKGYGIGMPKNFKYHNEISTAVLKLQESGEITRLRDKWWKQKGGGGKCEKSSGDSAAELTVANVGGVFLVLAIGIALSCLYTAWELFWEIGCTTCGDKGSFKDELKNELKFIVKCSESTKPVRKRKTGSSSRSEEDSTRGCTPPYGFVPTVITTTHEDN